MVAGETLWAPGKVLLYFIFVIPFSVASERHTRFNVPSDTPFVPTLADQTRQNVQNISQKRD